MAWQGRGDHRMRGRVTGEQYTQIDNPDPFASPVWRSPVYRTHEVVLWLVVLRGRRVRLPCFLIRPPLLDLAAAMLALLWLHTGWRGVAALASAVSTGLVMLRARRPDWFTRF